MGHEHRGFSREFRMFRAGLCNLGVEPRNQRLPLGGHPHARAVQRDHLAPIGGPGRLRISHHRGDAAERGIILRGKAGIGRQDHIGLGRRHRLEVDPVALVKEHRRRGAQFRQTRLDPGQDAIPVVIAEIRPRKAHRHHPQRQRHLVVAPGHRGDADRLFGQDGCAEGMVDFQRIGFGQRRARQRRHKGKGAKAQQEQGAFHGGRSPSIGIALPAAAGPVKAAQPSEPGAARLRQSF